MRTVTNRLLSTKRSRISSNRLITIFPDSEKYFEKRLWLFISINLWRKNSLDKRIDSFCARARQRDVFPDPGGPNSRINLKVNVSKYYRSIYVYLLFKSPVEADGHKADILFNEENYSTVQYKLKCDQVILI